MPLEDLQLSNFTAGELSPRMFGRTDYQRYYNGLATLKNMVAMPQGGVTKRPGTRFIAVADGSIPIPPTPPAPTATVLGSTGITGFGPFSPIYRALPPVTIDSPDLTLLLYVGMYQTNYLPTATPIPFVATIADTASLGWSRRGPPRTLALTSCGLTAPCHGAVECWWAGSSAPLSDEVITVTFSPGGVVASFIYLVVLSGPSILAPFDPNPSVPAFNAQTVASSVPTVPGVSTNDAPSLLITFTVEYDTLYAALYPQGAVLGAGGLSQPFDGFALSAVLTSFPQTAPLSDFTALGSTNSSANWIMIADAIA